MVFSSGGRLKLGEQGGRQAYDHDRTRGGVGKALLLKHRGGGRVGIGGVLVGEDRFAGTKNGPTQAGDRLSGTNDIKQVTVGHDLLVLPDIDPLPCPGRPDEAPEVMGLQVMVPFADFDEVVELRPAALRDRDDVVTLQAVGDAASGHGAHPVPLAQGGLEMRGNATAEVRDRGNVDALLDDELRPCIAEEVLDRRERNGSYSLDLTKLACLKLAPAERLGADM
jgi:hypothetical protein